MRPFLQKPPVFGTTLAWKRENEFEKSIKTSGDCLVRSWIVIFLAALSGSALGCDLYPLGIPKSRVVGGVWYGKVLGDIFEGTQPGNFGWLTWSGNPGSNALAASLALPGNSDTHYVNPVDSSDRLISNGDWVRGKPGVSNSRKIRNALALLKSMEIVLPIWDQAAGQGANTKYRIWAFARFRLLDFALPKKKIRVEFLWFESCGEGNDAPLVDAGLDQTITTESAAVLSGRVEDDGKPVWGELSVAWAKVDGPGDVTFADTKSPSTEVSFGTPGKYRLRLTANDGEGSVYDEVTVTVEDPNRVPSATAQSVSLAEDESVPIVLAGLDPDGDDLRFRITDGPEFGNLTGTAPNLIYTPHVDYNGSDEFFFAVSDGKLESGQTRVSIAIAPVNDPPVADPLEFLTTEDVPVEITLSGSDRDGDLLAFEIETPPVHGVLSGAVPNLVYTPLTDLNGSDEFTFKVSDENGGESLGTVSISILPVNDVPVASRRSVSVEEDGRLDIILGATDADEDPLAFEIVDQPAHGTLVGQGTNFVYIPSDDYNGPDSFVFQVSDANGGTATAGINITVTPVNDPPIAESAQVEVLVGKTVEIVFSATDLDGDEISYEMTGQPAHGTLSGEAPHLTFTPEFGYSGDDFLTFVARDPSSSSESATVAIKVGYFPSSKTWTTTEDFEEGRALNLSLETPDELRTTTEPSAVDAVWIPIFSKGTVVRIDSESGQVIGEYRTAPDDVSTPYPSRTTIDREGNLWVANKGDNSVTMIAAPGSGRWVDRNGNGILDTSAGIGDVRPWNGGGQSANVAEDELIIGTHTGQLDQYAARFRDSGWLCVGWWDQQPGLGQNRYCVRRYS